MPPELVGRDSLLVEWEAMLGEVATQGRVRSREVVLTGPRGVGKSVLLTRLAENATARGWSVIRLQGSRSASLVTALAQQTADRAEVERGPWERAREALGRISSASVSFAGFGGSIALDPGDTSTGTSGSVSWEYPESLAAALARLGASLRDDQSARDGREGGGGGLVISVDELQMTRADDIRLIGATLNQLNTAHPDSPVVFVAAGLPNTQARMVGPNPDQPNITNPERLFRFSALPPRLSSDEAAVALTRPAHREGVTWQAGAVNCVVEASECYPAHLQIYAAAAWAQGNGTGPVTAEHAQSILAGARAQVEEQYLAPRWRNLSPHHRAYLTALALCGGEAASGQVAAVLGTPTTAQSKRRESLINRGEIYDPEYGRVALSMPAMRQYALQQYPATVNGSEETLPPPQQMIANLEAWQEARTATTATAVAFPAAVLDRGRPANRPGPAPLPSGATNPAQHPDPNPDPGR